MATSQADSANSPQDDRLDEGEFVRLFVQYQRVVFAYLRAALGSVVNAEEVLQETSVILWRDRHQFVRGTNFVNWALAVAQNQVYKFRRNSKHGTQSLSEELLDQVAEGVTSQQDWVEARHRALLQCMEQLSEQDRALIRAAYGLKITKKAVGQRLGIAPTVFYKTLNRIRQRLLKCIKHRLSAEGGA